MIKKWFVLSSLLLIGGRALADTALVQLGPDGRPLALPIPSTESTPSGPTPVQITPTPPKPPTATAPTETGSLPNPWPNGYVYYTLPGGVNLVTPWSASILAVGKDFIGNDTIYQGYFPLVQWWKITMVFGGGIDASDSKLRGSPMGGGILNLANVQINGTADLHVAVTGGYNVNGSPINGKNGMLVLSGSIQFIK